MVNIWMNGIMGVVVGDALGLPVQFAPREERDADPVTDMRGHGVFDMPAGSWSDDSSLSENDLVLIQGPPGTGKTQVIAEICLQLFKINRFVE